MLTVKMLADEGHQVQVAENSRDTIKVLEKNVFDLILMDIHMPEMNGLEATSIIRENERLNGGHIPIIAVIALVFKEDKDRCLQAGMGACVAKPVRSKKLFEAIKKIVIMSSSCRAGNRPPEKPREEKAGNMAVALARVSGI